MAIYNTPVGQNAYQQVFAQKFANAWNPFVKTANRYSAGPSNTSVAAGENYAMPHMPQRLGGCRVAYLPVGGTAVLVGNGGGGTGYVIGDFVTMAPVNGGRPVIVKILAVSAGNPTSIQIIDPGSGLLGGGTGVNATTVQTASLNQASTTGVGTGATWSANVAVGLGHGPQGRSDA